jgi:hypothetical protein
MPYGGIHFCRNPMSTSCLSIRLSVECKEIVTVSSTTTYLSDCIFSTCFDLACHMRELIFCIGCQLPVCPCVCPCAEHINRRFTWMYSRQSGGISSEHWLTYFLFLSKLPFKANILVYQFHSVHKLTFSSFHHILFYFRHSFSLLNYIYVKLSIALVLFTLHTHTN